MRLGRVRSWLPTSCSPSSAARSAPPPSLPLFSKRPQQLYDPRARRKQGVILRIELTLDDGHKVRPLVDAAAPTRRTTRRAPAQRGLAALTTCPPSPPPFRPGCHCHPPRGQNRKPGRGVRRQAQPERGTDDDAARTRGGSLCHQSRRQRGIKVCPPAAVLCRAASFIHYGTKGRENDC